MKLSTTGCSFIAALVFSGAQQHSLAGSATWSQTPANNNWNMAGNWVPNTVPNGPSDVATFAPSEKTEVTISSSVTVSSVQYNAGAPPFTITVEGIGINLFVTGEGIVNDSGVTQSFSDGPQSAVFFQDGATAGDMTFFGGEGGQFFFTESSSAGTGTFDVKTGTSQGALLFFDNSSAAEATIQVSDFALADFLDNSTAANAAFIATSGGFFDFSGNATAANGSFAMSGGGGIGFSGSATAANGQFTANGAESSSEAGCFVFLADDTTAADSTFLINGGSAAGAPGAEMTFFGQATAANATLTANGGTAGGLGGSIIFTSKTKGGTASFSLNGNGNLDLSMHRSSPLTIGSLEGDGLVFLGGSALSVGSNNESTTFSGIIQDGGTGGGAGGSLTKIGSGTLTLSGANIYTGTTTVSAGALLVSNPTGSATGTGAIAVNSGTLGGGGIIAGAVTIGTGSGTGAFLAPAFGTNKQVTLTLQSSLTLQADATYTYTFKARKNQSRTDLVAANGVTISGATIVLQGKTQGRLKRGTVLTVLSKTSANAISGTFSNLADGAVVTVNGNNFQASYHGGDGNDLILTAVP
jgi:autotransporter-associated beta strand protein